MKCLILALFVFYSTLCSAQSRVPEKKASFDLEYCAASVTYWQMLNQTNPAALQSQVAALSERYSAAAMQDYFDILQRVDQFILSLTNDRTQLLLEQLRGNFLLSQAPSSAKANAVFEGFEGVNKRCNRAFGAADFMTRSVDTGQAVQIDAAKTLTLRRFNQRGNYYPPLKGPAGGADGDVSCGQRYQQARDEVSDSEDGTIRPFVVTWFETDQSGSIMHSTRDYIGGANGSADEIPYPQYTITPVTLYGVIDGRVDVLGGDAIDRPLDALLLPQGREHVGSDYRANATLYQLDKDGWLLRDVWFEDGSILPGTDSETIQERWIRYDALVCSDPESIFAATGRVDGLR